MQISSTFVSSHPSFGFSAAAFTPFFIILGLLAAGVLYMAYSIFVNSKISEKENKVEAMLEEISQEDSTWNEGELKQFVEETFYKVRSAVLEKNYNGLKELLHPSFYSTWEEQVQNLEVEPDQRTEMLSVDQVEVVDVKNYKNDENDSFTASVEFDGPEYTVHRTGMLKMLSKGQQSSNEEEAQLLVEYWTFEREGDNWALIGVNRQSSWKKFIKSQNVNE